MIRIRPKYVIICGIGVITFYILFNFLSAIILRARMQEEELLSDEYSTTSTATATNKKTIATTTPNVATTTTTNDDDSTTSVDILQQKKKDYHIYTPMKMDNALVFYVSHQNFAIVKKTVTCLQNDQTKNILLIGTNTDFSLQNEMETWLRSEFVKFPANEYRDLTEINNWPAKNFAKLQSHYKTFASRYANTIINEPEEYDPMVMAKKYALIDQEFLICMTNKQKQTLRRKKFAVVVPFIQNQKKALIHQLNRWSQKASLACSDKYKVGSASLKFDVIFYFHRSRNEEMEDKIIQALKPVERCFESVHFRYASLTDVQDQYPFGPNHMFFRLIHAPDMYLTYQYLLQAEPDLYPIRPNWIEHLTKLIQGTIRPFWILGSIYRGKDKNLGEIFHNIHINGNAIYNVGSAAFRQFLFEVSKKTHKEAYDTAVSKYMLEHVVRMRDVWHYLKFDDTILNMWDKEWKVKNILLDHPYTCFVHGRHNDLGYPKGDWDPPVAQAEQEQEQQEQEGAKAEGEQPQKRTIVDAKQPAN